MASVYGQSKTNLKIGPLFNGNEQPHKTSAYKIYICVCKSDKA